jgi:hypothetical protein
MGWCFVGYIRVGRKEGDHRSCYSESQLLGSITSELCASDVAWLILGCYLAARLHRTAMLEDPNKKQ